MFLDEAAVGAFLHIMSLPKAIFTLLVVNDQRVIIELRRRRTLDASVIALLTLYRELGDGDVLRSCF